MRSALPLTGLYAQNFLPSSTLMPICRFFASPVRGSAAPSAIHWRKSAITASGSLPFGGIFVSWS